MSSITSALQAGMAQLHPKEQELAAYVLAHPQQVTQLSITELAAQSQISTATISRFCKTFHFTGYADFKMKLSAELAALPAVQSYQDIVAGNDLGSIVQAIETNHLRSIADTTRLLDLAQLTRAVSALRAAKRIDIYGVATSGVVAQDFHQKLVRIGRHATCFSDPHMQLTSAANLGPGDAAFAISFSGETQETIDALTCAKEGGAATISLTGYGANKLAGLSDIALFTSSLERGMRRGDMASRIAQLHVIDILFTSLVSEQFDEYVPRLEQSYHMVRKYRKNAKTGL
ncbi:MurR/RpiR family transcriptional regulator [Paenibacillus cymbidii]|uniref:MurR/RpiR family transcriptional regulator n=1 Tax=Paenibacillus cymbidii TaxID=1639034 RepID=UPI00107FDE78|nr:MurR/RpiR family transcriptional regulator [Paenibacillus cymbidii]